MIKNKYIVLLKHDLSHPVVPKTLRETAAKMDLLDENEMHVVEHVCQILGVLILEV